ncbi:MAG: hypothetical protein D6702_05280 [Planctomycetota bacterium]|nr:MAG: hypothetical protein D6702_05280 [Planctomycetota bacterium]
MSLARRLLLAAPLGFLAGWAAGALESALVTATSDLVFADPLLDSVEVAWRYAVVGAVLALLLSLAPRRLRPKRPAAVLGAVLGLIIFVSGTSWIHQHFYGGRPTVAAGPLIANGILAAAALALGFGLGAVRTSYAAALLLAAAGHSGVVVTAAQPSSSKAAAATAPAGTPNVLMIVIDTLRADHLGCYGYGQDTSPRLDALAAGGLRFAAAYAQATWTRPSVASLMTSLHPASHLTNDLHARVAPELQTLAETAHDRGLATVGFSANRNVSAVFGFDQGFDSFWTHASEDLNSILRFTTWERVLEIGRGFGLFRNQQPPSVAADVTDRVLAWADGHDGRPWFAYVQYIDPHGPYDPPADFLAEIGVEPLDREAVAKMDIHHGNKPWPFFQVEDADPALVARLVELYDAEIRYCDREVGRLLDGLRERGMLDNTYVVVTADHGEEFYEHKQFGHGQSAFEELSHVPLIITGPGVRSGVVDQRVELIDLYPTVATWIGAAVPERIQGRDLGDLIAGGRRPEPSEALITNIKGYELCAWVFGHEKLVRIELDGKVVWQLYDLAADPGEQHDLAADQPQRVEELKAELLRRRLDSARFRLERAARVEAGAIDSDLRNELQSLGYASDAEE